MQRKSLIKKPKNKPVRKLNWADVRTELYGKFLSANIVTCEYKGYNCQEWPLTFAHSLRRNDIEKVRKAGDWELYSLKMREVARLCQACHSEVDGCKRKVSEAIVNWVISRRKRPIK